MKRFLGSSLALGLVACSQGTAGQQPDSGGTPDAGGLPTLTVTSVAPSHGPIDGGTSVAINGAGFAPGATVTFGSVNALSINVVSDGVIDAVTPPALDAGPVGVSVTLPEGTATLPGGFTYDAPPLPIAYCVLHFPTTLTGTPGASPGTIYGWVYIPGVTDQVGQGPGVSAQVGYGATGSLPDGTWNWSAANYDSDEDGETPGDHANDEYAGALPAVPAPGSYDYAVRFSRDQGATWTPCDTVGNTPTTPYSTANAGKLTVAAPVTPTIGYCALHAPTTLAVAQGATAGPVYGWVYASGVTDQTTSAGPGISGELGEGAHGSTPDGTWTWTPATWDAKQGPSAHNDEYMATLPAQNDAGAFDYAYRFTLADGGWSYCDSAGDQPYQPANAGQLTVADPPPLAIGFCATHFPTTLSVTTGQTAGPVYGWVYVAGLTDQGSTAAPGITAELGQGATGSTPDATWTWVPATWDSKQGPSGHDDEYMATLSAEADAGTFAYAFRFALGDGGFVSCDTLGDPTYAPASAGVLTVTLPDAGTLSDAGALPQPQVQFCSFAAPSQLLGEAFAVSTAVYGTVYATGLTPGLGQGPGITAQAGVGPLGSDPSQTDGWTWVNSMFVGDVDGLTPGGLANDQYAAYLTFPDAGSYAMAYRFSLDGGPARYCDANGDGTYTLANQGLLTVVPAPLTVDWCDLQSPPATIALTGQDAGLVYGQVYKAGVTNDAGQAGDILAQLGVGLIGLDPLDGGYTWTPAFFNGDRGANDEYAAPLLAPPDAGTYGYYFRFSEDNGKVWTICGYQNPIAAGGDAGILTVQ